MWEDPDVRKVEREAEEGGAAMWSMLYYAVAVIFWGTVSLLEWAHNKIRENR